MEVTIPLINLLLYESECRLVNNLLLYESDCTFSQKNIDCRMKVIVLLDNFFLYESECGIMKKGSPLVKMLLCESDCTSR